MDAPGRKLRPFRSAFVSTCGGPPCRHRSVPVTETDLDASWTDTLDRLQAFVAARVDDRELAADITQDVIVRSIASGALERVDNPAAWLYRSARNAVIDHYRTRKSHDPLDDLDAWPEPDESDDLPERRHPRAVALPPAAARPARSVGTRRARPRRRRRPDPAPSGRSTLGISLSGMKSRVQRARRDLKQLLEHCCAVALDSTGGIAGYRPNRRLVRMREPRQTAVHSKHPPRVTLPCPLKRAWRSWLRAR